MRVSGAFRFLTLLGCLFLGGCESLLPAEAIDPDTGLTRKDFSALRHRGHALPGADKDVDDDGEDGALAVAQGPAPPIPVAPEAKPPPPPAPDAEANEQLVSVNITDTVPLRQVLVELGREGHVNMEIDPRIQGGIIFSAHERPFPEVLKRICALAGLRYRLDGPYMRVELDEPYQQTYPVDYLSLTRHATSETAIATNVFDTDVTGNGNGGTNRSSANGDNNNSTAKVAGNSDADFWAELDKSLTQVLATTARNRPLLKDAAATPPANFSLDRQAGLVTVFANSAQQDAVRAYLDRLQHKASSQVLIEARIVEVELDDSFRSGINWQTLFKSTSKLSADFGAATAASTSGLFTATLANSDFSGILSLVRGYGTTRILSSPRLTVLNNQTAVLKVARNEVYFLTTAQFPTTLSTAGVPVSGTPVFSSTPHTVPVGLVMTVQPAIDDAQDRVTMTLRPTVSRVVDHVDDPSIGLNAAQAGVKDPVRSQIPVLAVREMDSVLRLRSGEVAVMGGLMQDSALSQENGVPPFDEMPMLNSLAKSSDHSGQTSELVILLRATILDNPAPDSADADLYERYHRDPRPLPMPEPTTALN